ncbi:MAG: hypothetical protein FD123_1705 [Bacteroidetes bacterium]|nr:MAG: hypothetical protein FD123_1705 [Bacteroidota bacterium]
MEKTVMRIHFSDRPGVEFERLTFAYASRQKDWDKIEWLGQVGHDGGRDVWGEYKNESTCYLCANHSQLTINKAKGDIDTLAKKKTVPNNLVVVCGGTVSANLRKKVQDYGKDAGAKTVEVWSGVEFEEKLRKETPELIKRFVEGEPFPDSPVDLIKAAKDTANKSDQDILELLGECIDRPAMTTRLEMESSLPNFQKGLEDIIEVLNTGVHRLRSGEVIRTIPSRHRIADKNMKKKLSHITNLVVQLRDTFVSLKKKKEIRPCGCGNDDCPTFMLSPEACRIMDGKRREILDEFRKLNPDFKAKL